MKWKIILQRPYLGKGIYKVWYNKDDKTLKKFKTYKAAINYAIKLSDYYQVPVVER